MKLHLHAVILSFDFCLLYRGLNTNNYFYAVPCSIREGTSLVCLDSLYVCLSVCHSLPHLLLTQEREVAECSCHSLTHYCTLPAEDCIASSTSNDLGLRSGQHQQTGQCLLPLVAAMFFVDDPADASNQRREESMSSKTNLLQV